MTPLAKAAIAIVDTETTGKDPATSELLEIAAYRFVAAPGTPGTTWQTFVRPTKPIPSEASSVHHIVDSDVADAPGPPVALQSFIDFCGGVDLLVAHHAEFDRAMLAPALDHVDAPWLCSERLAHHLVPAAPNFKLATLYYYLGGPKIETALHRAEADVEIALFVLRQLFAQYEKAARAIVGDDEQRFEASQTVEKIVEFSARPYVIKNMPFGKHVGEPLSNVPDRYFRWMLDSMTDLSADLRWNIERELRIRQGGRAA